jgi:hypothetical protein
MMIKVTSVEWTWLGLELKWPPAWYVAKCHASLLSSYLLENFLYFGVH